LYAASSIPALSPNLGDGALVGPADAVMFCLSKGLACPIGSVLVGERSFIAEARRIRQRLGGGWRQAGIVAAAGVVALKTMIDRLVEDHALARDLARRLVDLGMMIDLAQIQTNIVRVDLSLTGLSAEEFSDSLAKHAVWVKVIAPRVVRMVTHKDVLRSDVRRVVDAVANVLAEQHKAKEERTRVFAQARSRLA
jgi:threonine aldolase